MTSRIGDEDNGGWVSATSHPDLKKLDFTLTGPECDTLITTMPPKYVDNERMVPRFDEPNKSPKSLDSSHKVPVTLCPASAIIAIALVIAQGHKKPGRTIYNWRTQPISLMSYLDAVNRHLLKLVDGEDLDEEMTNLAGVPIRHDWAAMSGLAIIEDARQAGTLIDDRPTKGGAAQFLKSVTPVK